MISLRDNLKKIGITNESVSFREFYSVPSSMRSAMRAMENPHPEKWGIGHEESGLEGNWTRSCNGVARNFKYWFFSSNHKGKRRVYRFDAATGQAAGFVKFGNSNGHLGDIDFYNGYIWCALEHPHQIGQVPADSFDWIDRYYLCDSEGGPATQKESLSWCAFNPCNNLLYSSENGHTTPPVDLIYAYKFTGTEFRNVPEANIKLKVKIKMIQGGVFSDNGHLLLASDSSEDIRVFSVLNGHYYGRVPIQVADPVELPWVGDIVAEEVQGLTIWKNWHYGDVKTHVHLILLDEDVGNDDVYFKHYTVPDWEFL